ncbi:unnamed protein product [Symbiodinium sp. CCMP2592]|nr:unnamed protein product [Symbiodinium sp. CCMP2592]
MEQCPESLGSGRRSRSEQQWNRSSPQSAFDPGKGSDRAGARFARGRQSPGWGAKCDRPSASGADGYAGGRPEAKPPGNCGDKLDASSLLGGSSSDDSEGDRKTQNRGLRAVSTLHRLHDRIQKNPRKIYLTYEKEIREELGIASFVEEVQGDDQALFWWSKAFVNTFVAGGNFVVLGCPSLGSSALEPRFFHRVDVQQYSEKLLGEVVEFASVELIFGSLTCSSKRSVLEEMLQLNFASYGVGQVPAPAGALPVAADRVAVPETAGWTRWTGYLRARRQWLEHEADLARKLLRTGVAQLVCERDLPRPENNTMPHLGWEALPSGTCFVRMLLEPNEFLRGSGEDLKNFYYVLKLPAQWVRYNPVGRRVSKEVVREFGGDVSQDHRLCFRVLGMGDKNACSIAPATHESILQHHGLLKAEHKLVYGCPVPTDPLWEGVYLDDLLITLKDAGLVHAKKAEAAYVEAKLPRALQKSFRARREFFCLLHHFYVFVSKMVPGRTVRLPGYIADELRAVAFHLCLATWSMRSHLASSLLATHATPSSGGAVRAEVAPLAAELWRRSEIRGAPVRLDPDTDHLLKAPLSVSFERYQGRARS